MDRHTIRSWIATRDQISMISDGPQARRRKQHPGRQVKNFQAEELLFNWFEAERDAGLAVSNVALQQKMRELAGASTKASPRWMQGELSFIIYRMEAALFNISSSGH